MKSLEELKAIKEKMRGQVEFRSEDGVWTEDNPYRKHVLVCEVPGVLLPAARKLLKNCMKRFEKIVWKMRLES